MIMIKKPSKIIVVSCQPKMMPKRTPKKNDVKASQIAPNLVPTSCSRAVAAEERRTLIALELFSGRSK